jgi:two-component system OmpR family response regulator
MRVLVVDDEREVTFLLGEALRRRGYIVALASTGHEAIEEAERFQPDVALIDVGLPDMDGVTLAELLRGTVTTRPLRVIGFSGRNPRRLRAAVRRDVFDDYIRKPATVDNIERLLAPAV